MNLVFIGSSLFGLRCLKACLELPFIDTGGVVTASQTFGISYRPDGVANVLHADMAAFAQSHDIPVQTLQRSMNEPDLWEAVSNWKPDAFLVAGWYHMIPRQWRDLAPAYGLHASLLPDYSGGAPLVWAMTPSVSIDARWVGSRILTSEGAEVGYACRVTAMSSRSRWSAR